MLNDRLIPITTSHFSFAALFFLLYMKYCSYFVSVCHTLSKCIVILRFCRTSDFPSPIPLPKMLYLQHIKFFIILSCYWRTKFKFSLVLDYYSLYYCACFESLSYPSDTFLFPQTICTVVIIHVRPFEYSNVESLHFALSTNERFEFCIFLILITVTMSKYCS